MMQLQYQLASNISQKLALSGTVISALSGLIYMMFRYRNEEALGNYSSIAPIALYLITFLFIFLVSKRFFSRKIICEFNWGTLFMALTFPFLIYILLQACSIHIWDKLVAVHSINSPNVTFQSWAQNGVTRPPTNLNLDDMHSKGDEVAHLVAMAAINKKGILPTALNSLIDPQVTLSDSEKGKRSYWLYRHFLAHPPGYAIFCAPLSKNPPFSRCFNILVFAASLSCALWAGLFGFNRKGVGIFFLVCAASIPQILWASVFVTSTDIMPCIPAFIACGLFFKFMTNEENNLDKPNCIDFLKIGFLLSLACFITYTPALTTVGITMIIIFRGERRWYLHALLVSVPAFITVAASLYYGSVVLGGIETAFNGLFSAGKEPQAVVGTKVTELIRIFTELPQRIGPPACLLLITSVALIVSQLYSKPNEYRRTLSWVTGGLAVISPSLLTSRLPQIRYLLPSLLLVLISSGGLYLWRNLNLSGRAVLLASLASFAFSKFVILRWIT